MNIVPERAIPQITGWLRQLPEKLRRLFLSLLADIGRWPLAAWIYLGFSVVFFLYFIWPTFLNPYHQLRLFTNFPELKPLGADLREYLDFTKALVQTGTPYIGQNYYPPFESVFFLRFYQMGPDLAYVYLTGLSFLSYLGITFLFPLLSAQNRRLSPAATFAVVTGLFSYGLWFQLERGQYDLIVMALCLGAIYLYQRHPRLRLLAYLLFIVSVQIKLYPAVFILCFAVDWHDWKPNLRRWGLLALANLAGLFVLGPKVFVDFISALTSQVGRPTYWGAGNHSINSFVTTLINQYHDNREFYNQLKLSSGWYQLALLVVFLVFFALVLWITYRDRRSPANPYVLMLCTIAAMVIPSTSHDYKLCIFAAPMVLLLNSLNLAKSGRRWLDWAGIVLVLLLTIAYSTTLFLHTDLPLLLTSNFPALLVISAAAALLMAVRSRQARLAGSADEFQELQGSNPPLSKNKSTAEWFRPIPPSKRFGDFLPPWGKKSPYSMFSHFMTRLAGIPWLTWVMLSFFGIFFVYFIQPTFLNAYHELRLYPDFPQLQPLGADLHEYLTFSQALRETGTPYIGNNYYPPFQSVFFFRLMRSVPERAYVVMNAISFACFLAITWLYPLLNSKKRRFTSLAGFALVTGLFSYGLWFEFERGQFDLIVMALCFAGIYIYHRHPRLRFAAYLLFVLSVQIKLYPGIFILCFATDWRAWKPNLRRWGLLLLANFAGLFVLGPKVFLDFLHALTDQVGRPSYWGPGNHSINSFVTTLIDQTRSPEQLYLALKANSLWMQLALLAVFLACFAAVLWITYRDRLSPGSPYVILLCTIAAMVIPSTSHDYKFCIFAAPIALLLNSLDQSRSGPARLNLAAAALLVVITTAYATTLFLHNDLPYLLTNNLPALLLISAAAALLMAVRSRQAKTAGVDIEFHDLK